MVPKQPQDGSAPVAAKSPAIVIRERISWAPLLMTAALVSTVMAALLTISQPRSVAAAVPVPAVPAPAVVSYQSPLGLKVVTRKQQVDIRWDRDSALIAKAEKGLMKVTEGETIHDISLDRRDLREGYVAYSARTNDVRIQLDVTQADGTTTSESARVVAIP